MSDPRLARPLWRGRTNVDALTIACIERAEQIVRQVHPDIAHDFIITQGSYQSGGGDVNSAGTHHLGGVVDLRWCGHLECILALRLAGMAGTWHRTPAQGPWPDHTHAVVYGHPYLAASAARQISAVLSGRNGLANNGPDDGPRLSPFPPATWPPTEEDDMFSDDDRARLTRLEAAVAQLAKEEKRRGDNQWKREAALAKALKDQGVDVDAILAKVAQ